MNEEEIIKRVQIAARVIKAFRTELAGCCASSDVDDEIARLFAVNMFGYSEIVQIK